MKKIITLTPIALILTLAGQVQAASQGDVMLRGAIIDSTCEISINNGAAELNVGSFGKKSFSTANKQVGQEPLKVSLTQCGANEKGALLVTGIVGSDSSVFISNTASTAGFMLTTDDGVTQVKNNQSVPVTADGSGNLDFTFKTGMTVMDIAKVVPGEYDAPIKISYITN